MAGASLAAALPSWSAPVVTATTGDAFTVESDDGSLTMTPGGDRVLWFSQQGESLVFSGQQRYTGGVTKQWWDLTLTPPAGSRFEAGRTYTIDPQSPDGSAGLFLGGNGSSCSGPAAVTVGAVTYDDTGSLSSLAADYELTCPAPVDRHYTGVVRWRSAQPWTSVEVDPVPASTLVVDEAQTRTVTLRNLGTADLHPSAVALSGTAADDWSVTRDGCEGLLPAGSQCDLVLGLRPTTAAPSRSADLVVTDDSVRGQHHVQLTTQVLPVSPPLDLRAAGTLDGVVLTWTPGPGRPAAGYVVERDARLGSGVQVAELPAGTTTYTYPYADSSDVWYRVLAVPAGAGEYQGSAPVVARRGQSDLVVAGSAGGSALVAVAAPGSTVRAPLAQPASPVQGLAVSPRGDVAYSADGRVVGQGECRSCGDPLGARDPAWSPDSRRLSWARPDGTAVVHTVWGLVEPDLLLPVSSAMQPVWLPDGSGVIVADTRPGLPLRRVGFTGTPVPLTGTEGGRHPAVSPRGDHLAWLVGTGTDTQLRERALSGGTATTVLSGDLRHVSWTPDGSAVVAVRRTSSGSEVVQITTATSSASVLWSSTDALDAAFLRVQDVTSPTIEAAVGPWTSGSVSVPIHIVDDTIPLGGMVVTCSLDGAPSTPCPSGWAGRVAAGQHTLTIRANDLLRPEATRQVVFTADTSAPTVAMTTAATATTTSTATFRWTAKDVGAGTASYDVRYRSAGTKASGFTSYSYPATWQRRTSAWLSFTVSSGTEYCVSVRARDKVGNLGAWSRETCTARVLDDRSLSASSGWTRARTSAALGGSQTTTSRYRASLSVTGVHVRRVAVVVRTCPSCGSVDVFVGSRKIGTVSTYSSTTRYRVVKYLPLQSVTRTGTFLLRTTSSRPVAVDAVLLRRT